SAEAQPAFAEPPIQLALPSHRHQTWQLDRDQAEAGRPALQAGAVLTRGTVEPAAEGAKEIARIGETQQVGDLQQTALRLRQVLHRQFATGVLEQALETAALLLQASLQGALRQVQRLRYHLALGLTLRQQAAEHLTRHVANAAVGEARQILTGE